MSFLKQIKVELQREWIQVIKGTSFEDLWKSYQASVTPENFIKIPLLLLTLLSDKKPLSEALEQEVLRKLLLEASNLPPSNMVALAKLYIDKLEIQLQLNRVVDEKRNLLYGINKAESAIESKTSSPVKKVFDTVCFFTGKKSYRAVNGFLTLACLFNKAKATDNQGNKLILLATIMNVGAIMGLLGSQGDSSSASKLLNTDGKSYQQLNEKTQNIKNKLFEVDQKIKAYEESLDPSVAQRKILFLLAAQP